jgi:hypothetical protein
VNVAITALAAVIGTVQLPVPGQAAPTQPVNVEVASGAAVSVTLAAASKDAAQVVPQVIPAGMEATVPPPVPALVTSRTY